MKYKFYNLNGEYIKTDFSYPNNITGLVIFPDGMKIWYENNKIHRNDGAAIEYIKGRKRWFFDDKEYTQGQYELLVDVIKLKKYP